MTVLAIDVAWSRPDPASVKARGYTAVIGYISRDPSKCLSRAYADACHAQGLDVGLVFEDSANRARQGAGAGTADGQFVLAHLNALGAPPEVACYYAVDYAAPASDHPAIVAYFQAAAAAMRPHPEGAYGDADVDDWARAGGIPLEWGTVAWSGGRTAAGIALFQRVQQDFGGGADVDEIRLAEWGQWRAVRPAAHPDTTPPTPAPTAARSDIMATDTDRGGLVRLTYLAVHGREPTPQEWGAGKWTLGVDPDLDKYVASVADSPAGQAAVAARNPQA